MGTDSRSGKSPGVSLGDGSNGLTTDVTPPNAYCELQRRVADSPLRFSFTWRETEFRATVEAGEGWLRLTLQNDLAPLPYSVEGKSRRNSLLAIVDTHHGEPAGKLRVVRGRDVVLEGGIELPRGSGNTVNDIVSTLTILVLRAAPHLDLLAERATSLEGLNSTPH